MTSIVLSLFGGMLPTLSPEEAESAIQSFCKLIQFETVSNTGPSSGAYEACADYILSQLSSISCLDSIQTLPNSPKNSPVIVARWKGEDESLPVLLLNCHYDVVPALNKDWTVPPFQGLRQNGRIYGRGTQDMKCVCIQYMEAIRKLSSLSELNFRPLRSIYVSFVPDEEVGGGGMATFLSSTLYQSLPGIALALDEGLASPTSTYSVFYGERLPWWIQVDAKGNTGHGSRFIEPTAVEQIIQVANKALEFRQEQRNLLFGSLDQEKHSNCSHAMAKKNQQQNNPNSSSHLSTGKKLGDVTSLNVTTLQAGVRSGNDFVYNVVPPSASLSLDIRISPHVSPSDIKTMLDTWCQECQPASTSTSRLETPADDDHFKSSITWNYIGNHGNDMQQHATTSTDVKVNPWYDVFTRAMDQMNLEFIPEVFPAATDSRFLRALGIRALGFSPMRNSEILLHENDEYIDENMFVEGIGVYVGLIQSLASAIVEEDK